MNGKHLGLIRGLLISLFMGMFSAVGYLLCNKFRRKHLEAGNTSSPRVASIPKFANAVADDASLVLSDSTVGQPSPKAAEVDCTSLMLNGPNKKNDISLPGIQKYAYRDLQKATSNFTTLIGQGAFGSVYKARMCTGKTVAVKVLSSNSKQGEKEFHAEVMLLGRLHHRNLVNLLGYCADKGQHMLVYVYMSNDSVASHLYGKKHGPLSWNLRVNIALDVARGLEYLHDGAVPPVVHCDIKSSNVLLDQCMRAGVADFGLSREAVFSCHTSNVKGTFGYLDPDYVSSRTFTKKSDVYSFGVLLFEMISGRMPQQGLMEYVELAAINTEGRVAWDELVDSQLAGVYDVQELNDMAALAYKCISRESKKRPSMSRVVQALLHIVKARASKRHHERKLLLTGVEIRSIDQELPNVPTSIPRVLREESIDSSSDLPDV